LDRPGELHEMHSLCAALSSGVCSLERDALAGGCVDRACIEHDEVILVPKLDRGILLELHGGFVVHFKDGLLAVVCDHSCPARSELLRELTFAQFDFMSIAGAEVPGVDWEIFYSGSLP